MALLRRRYQADWEGNRKLNHRRFNDSTADLRQLMTALPMTEEMHAAIMRKRVEARRAVEDAKEAAKRRQEFFTEK